MIYRDGKKIGALYRDGKAITKAFRDGKLVWQKAGAQTAKKIKSVTVEIPSWKTIDGLYWKCGLQLVGASSSGYYIDASIRGRGIRLRGTGGSTVGTLNGNKIEIPETANLTTDDVSIGQNVPISIKAPSKSYAATVTRNGAKVANSRRANRYYAQFGSEAIIIPDSNVKISTNVTTVIFEAVYYFSFRESGYSTQTYNGIDVGGDLKLDELLSTQQSKSYNKTVGLSSANVSKLISALSSFDSYKPKMEFVYTTLALADSHSSTNDISVATPAFTKTINMPITAIETY